MNGNRSSYFGHEQKLSDDYQTPEWFYKILDNEFKFVADMACDSKNCKIIGSPLFDREEFALEMDWNKWEGWKYVFPPFSKPYFQNYLRKAHTEWKKGESSVVLAPLKTISVDYYQDIKAPLVIVIYPRIRFLFNGMVNEAAESVCLLVYDSEMKGSQTMEMKYQDLSRFKPRNNRE